MLKSCAKNVFAVCIAVAKKLIFAHKITRNFPTLPGRVSKRLVFFTRIPSLSNFFSTPRKSLVYLFYSRFSPKSTTPTITKSFSFFIYNDIKGGA